MPAASSRCREPPKAPFRPAELNAMLELAQQGMQELFELQRAALAE